MKDAIKKYLDYDNGLGLANIASNVCRYGNLSSYLEVEGSIGVYTWFGREVEDTQQCENDKYYGFTFMQQGEEIKCVVPKWIDTYCEKNKINSLRVIRSLVGKNTRVV